MREPSPQVVILPNEALGVVGVTAVPRLLLTLREVADSVGISERMMGDLVYPKGPFRAVKLGDRSLRFSVESLREDIARLQQEQNAAKSGNVRLRDSA